MDGNGRLARVHGRLTLGLAMTIEGANRNTIKQHLRSLVSSGRLRLQGSGRASYYEPC